MTYVTAALGGSYHYLNIEEGADLLSAQSALNAIDTTSGKGATVVITARHMILTGTLKVPDRIVLAGSGVRRTFINAAGTGAMFEFDGAEYSGLRDMRLGMGPDASLISIDIKTDVKSCRKLEFRNLEIAGTEASGQIGIRSITSGSNIISECSFNRILLVQIDRPVLEIGPEGNFWTDITVDQFARDGVPRAAIDSVSHASFYTARVAGTVAVGSVAYRQAGNRNIANIAADIGAGSAALDIDGISNIVLLERPEQLTPVGSSTPSTTIIDGDGMQVSRCAFRGTPPTASQFALSGFGSTATVTDIQGCDQRIKFTINSSGTGQTAFPTVGFWFSDGNWPTSNPIVQVTRDGGNQNDKGAIGTSGLNDRWGFTFGATPVSGESYAFIATIG